MNKKKTPQCYAREVKALASGISVIGEYQDRQTKILHRHSCGREWLAKPRKILAGQGCPSCKGPNAKKRTNLQYDKELKACRSGIRRLGDYTSNKSPLLHVCRCGHEWEVGPVFLLRGGGCPKCANRHREITLQGGHKKRLQGFEPNAIKVLIKRLKLRPTEIESWSEGSVSPIRYWFKGKRRDHRPDFYVPKVKTFFEVKSVYTFGVEKSQGRVYGQCPGRVFQINKAKAKAAVSQGLKLEFLLLDRAGEVIRLPRNWHLLTHKEVKRKLIL